MGYDQDLEVLNTILKQQKEALAPNEDDGAFFELFSIEQILRDYDLGIDEIKSGITDDAHDGKIDAFYTIVNGVLIRPDTEADQFKKDVKIDLHIFQAKRATSFTEAPIVGLKDSLEKLLSFKPLKDPTEFNDAVKEAVQLFTQTFLALASKKPQLSIHVHYVTRGDAPAESPTKKMDSLREALQGMFSAATVVTNFVGASELYYLFNKQEQTTISLPMHGSAISTAEGAYICAVKLRDYVGAVADGGAGVKQHLCDHNVRAFQGNTEVNEEITKTLEVNKDLDFWCVNNGITITADQASITGTTIHIENMQIVNGLQTTHQLCAYGATHADAFAKDERTVLLRVIVPPSDEDRDRIIRATNSQTAVGPANLRATDKIHRSIETFLLTNGLYYERRKNFYKNQAKPLDSIISIQTMGQGIAAVLLREPHSSRGKPSSLLKNDSTYDKIFDEKIPMKCFLNVARIVKAIEDVYRDATETEYRSDRRYLMWHAAMRVAMVLTGTVFPSRAQIAEIPPEKITRDIVKESLFRVAQVLQTMGSPAESAKLKASTDAVITDLGADENGLLS